MSETKPIELYWRQSVPNPAKVVTILEELQLPYTGKFVEMADLKKEPFESVNPNGRVPAIHDPNTGITLWESGAIVQYLIATYDKEHKLTYTTSPEIWHLQQWEHFQASGQGPYFGQAAWFLMFHPEPVESAKTRYINEALRVTGVLDKFLAGKTEKDADGNVWLVGNKCTYADLSFAAWYGGIAFAHKTAGRPAEEWDVEKKFPAYAKWQNAMMARKSSQKASSLQKVEDVHL